MAGFSLILVMFPFIVGFIGLIIAAICFVGICLMVGGASGFILRKLYIKETGSKENAIKSGWSIATFIVGVAAFLFPAAYFIFIIIAMQ